MAQIGIESMRSEYDFNPSLKTLLRIVQILTKKGSEGKTQLSLDANLNYTRLAKHVVWLEKKGIVKSTVEGSKIDIGLTPSGKVFASVILKD